MITNDRKNNKDTEIYNKENQCFIEKYHNARFNVLRNKMIKRKMLEKKEIKEFNQELEN